MGLFDVFSSGPAEEAAAAKKAALERGYQQYTDLANQGRGAINTNYTAALQPYQQLQQTGMPGYQLYGDVTGAGGAAGQDRARALFQTDPGYQFARDEALDAATRTSVARGGAEGNNIRGNMDLASNIASKGYGDWVSRLAPWLGQGQQTAAGMAGINTGLGNQLAGSYGQQGQAALGTQQGIGEADYAAEMAPYNASANMWGLGLNALKGVAGLPLNSVGGRAVNKLFS
jgi:hypothetical protein